MAVTPWLSSDDIINVIQRRISVPLAQETFTPDDLLDFVNGELYDSQVPTVMIAHEEYFTYRISIPLQDGLNRYPIPDRAIGMKLRELFWQDNNGNLNKMARINPDNQDIYQSTNLVSTTPYIFFLEGNDVVFTLPPQVGVPGNLVMVFFLRPNKLVQNENAFIVNSFSIPVTIDSTTMVVGDSFSVNNIPFVAVASSPNSNQFILDPSSSINTATNLVTAINALSNQTLATASNGTPATAAVNINSFFRNINLVTTSTGIAISQNMILTSLLPVPSNIIDGASVDFLQTKPGHKIYTYGILLLSGSVASNTITVPNNIVPPDFIKGDYLCLEYTCIIPGIPPELHSLLAERGCARVLSAQGDIELLNDTNNTIKQMESNQGVLINNRVEGSTQKIVNRNSLISINKYRIKSLF